MSTAPLHYPNHGNDERARIEDVAAKLRAPVAGRAGWGRAHLPRFRGPDRGPRVLKRRNTTPSPPLKGVTT